MRWAVRGGDCPADEDGDGVCDTVDDCVGEYDACGVCNGPGASLGLRMRGRFPKATVIGEGNQLDALWRLRRRRLPTPEHWVILFAWT